MEPHIRIFSLTGDQDEPVKFVLAKTDLSEVDVRLVNVIIFLNIFF